MTPVIFNLEQTKLQKIADLESEGFFLNPSKSPDKSYVFALKGTKEQFDQFYILCAEEEATRKACFMYGLNFEDESINKLRNELSEHLFSNFKPWYLNT